MHILKKYWYGDHNNTAVEPCVSMVTKIMTPNRDFIRLLSKKIQQQRGLQETNGCYFYVHYRQI